MTIMITKPSIFVFNAFTMTCLIDVEMQLSRRIFKLFLLEC